MKSINQSGQITIFFSSVIVVMLTLLAFIINIGIFVKAKINLQNATDAAAYAGAAVQARQLTTIANLNWEMRNTYKEWMFKYYVLGGLNLRGVNGLPRNNCNSSITLTDGMDFTTCPYDGGNKVAVDSYNFPSVCIDFAGTGGVGLCTRFQLPGLPRFETSNVIGLDGTTNAFIDSIVSQKAKDCTERSKLNFLTANVWAYNIEGDEETGRITLKQSAPEITTNRQGAFPRAFELALRIRNLEAQVNKAPESKVCFQQGSALDCNVEIQELVTSEATPSNERVYKAFFSGFRNLGSESDNEMRRSFTLTEIPPQEVPTGNPFSLSNLLIPANKPGATKRYLDLKMMPVNYSTFYTAFTAGNGIVDTAIGDANAEGQCTATKIGLPVPGYPMGFTKNPDVLTYYAVKGEAQFVGLFNPFSNDALKLTAYAAAKPFGGRIGPMLFDTKDGVQVKARTGTFKSSPFMLALDTEKFKNQYGEIISPGTYSAGVPLPLNTGGAQYWSDPQGGTVIGGSLGSGTSITFGIPNMIYDYPSGDIEGNNSYRSSNEAIQSISTLGLQNSAGLYNKQMFTKFSNNLRNLGGVVTVKDIDDGILMARAPTIYDTKNYLIPTPEELNKESGIAADSFGAISVNKGDTISDSKGRAFDVYRYSVYAPLFSNSPDSLYSSAEDITAVLSEYLDSQEPAITKYVNSMNLAAMEIYRALVSTQANTDTKLGLAAAQGISDLPVSILDSGDPAAGNGEKPTCKSIAGQFAYFYLGDSYGITDNTGCPAPFRELMVNRWKTLGSGGALNIEYTLPRDLRAQLFSAYRPGEEHDVKANGSQTNPITGGPSSEKMLRNSYSTKFIALSSLVAQTVDSYSLNRPIFSEGNQSDSVPELESNIFNNPINPSAVGLDLNKVKH